MIHKVSVKVQLCPSVSSKSLEVQNHAIPLLNALMCGCLEAEGLLCGSTFTLCHAIVKTDILYEKQPLDQSLMGKDCMFTVSHQAYSTHRPLLCIITWEKDGLWCIDKPHYANICLDSQGVKYQIVTGICQKQEPTFLPYYACLLYTSPSPRDKRQSRMPSSA